MIFWNDLTWASCVVLRRPAGFAARRSCCRWGRCWLRWRKKKEGQKNRELYESAGTGPTKGPRNKRSAQKTSVGVRSFFGATKSQKSPWLPRSGNSDRVGVPKGTLSSTERRTTQLFWRAQETSWKSGKSVRSTKKTLTRSSPSHGTLTKEEEWHRNANLSPCPKKSNQSRWRRTDLNSCRQKEYREPTGACVVEFLTRDSGTEIG
jgi:hypothetical protein